MKKLAISTLALLIACPAFAGAYSDDPTESTWQLWGLNTYIGIHGGLSYTNLNYRFNDAKETAGDMVWQGHASMGLEVCKTWRSEIEYSIFTKAKDTKDFGDIQGIELSTKLQTLLMNNYMEFGDWDVIRPFVGIGLGIAFVDVDASGPASSLSKTKFSGMGTVGVTFDMDRFAVDIAGRYNYVDVASGLHNFGGDIGVRFKF